jgi:hypothetical protein
VFKIVNVNTLDAVKLGWYQAQPNYFYCGRIGDVARHERPSCNTALGNPFKMRDESERAAVIEKYHHYLVEVVKRGLANQLTDPKEREMWDDLMRMVILHRANVEITLACFCAPKPCHCDVIKRAVEYLAKNPLVQPITA